MLPSTGASATRLGIASLRRRSGSGTTPRPSEGLGAGRVPPSQLREVAAREVEIREVAVVEPMQLVQRAVVADPLACPERELAEEAPSASRLSSGPGEGIRARARL